MSVAKDGEKLILRCSLFIDAEGSSFRCESAALVEKIVKTGEVSRLISRPSVYAFPSRSSSSCSFSAAVFSKTAGSLKGDDRVFLFFFFLSSPSVVRNHGEVSPSTKGVSTDPERVSSKSRNRKRFSRIFTEFTVPQLRLLVNRILSMRAKA